METSRITHRYRLECCLEGENLDRTPIALWRHFPVDDQSPDTLAGAILDFQRMYEFDLVKVTPASSFCLKDWGSEDIWQGSTEGTRDYVRKVIKSPEDWLKLHVLDPYRGSLGDQLNCLRIVCNELGPDVPVLQTIFSPLSQAKNLVGSSELLVHIRQHPEEVQSGLKIIAESTQRFIDAACKSGIAGIFYAVQHASYKLLSESEYLEFGMDDDLSLVQAAGDKWLNMLHIHGDNVMFNLFSGFPVQVLNWHDRDTYPSLAEAQNLFGGIMCGGLQRIRTMVLGSPEQVFSEARDAINTTGNKRLILGTGCVLPITTPRANILAAIQSCQT